MKKKPLIAQAARRDVQNTVRLDLQIGEGVSVGQTISIGTLISGPVHLHLTIDRKPPEPEPK